MSKRSVLHFVKDILDAIEKVERYVEGQTYESFAENDMVLDATVRNLEIIGEAARHIPDEIRQRYLTVNWRRVVGFRNVVIHAYFDVDPQIVWHIATNEIQVLKPVIEQMRKDMETG